MPVPADRIIVPYEKARDQILDADILLYHGTGLISRAIRVAGRSDYSHAAMAGWINRNSRPSLMCFEVREVKGGCISNMSWQAKEYPNRIDVYRLVDQHTQLSWQPAFDGDLAVGQIVETIQQLDRVLATDEMRKFANPGEYGYWNIMKSALLHLPGLRLFFTQPVDDLQEMKRPPYCSQAVSVAIRRAFTDLVRNTPDSFTHPGDLDKCPLLNYIFTIGPPST